MVLLHHVLVLSEESNLNSQIHKECVHSTEQVSDGLILHVARY